MSTAATNRAIELIDELCSISDLDLAKVPPMTYGKLAGMVHRLEGDDVWDFHGSCLETISVIKRQYDDLEKDFKELERKSRKK